VDAGLALDAAKTSAPGFRYHQSLGSVGVSYREPWERLLRMAARGIITNRFKNGISSGSVPPEGRATQQRSAKISKRLVTQIFTSWNRAAEWLSLVEALQKVC
jgi:hypothetical protein